MLITGSALFFMAFLGFNTAFAPTLGGIIGNPLYHGLFLGGSATNTQGLLTGMWWSQQSTGLTIGTYFLFETAFASVTLALVGVIVLRKVKMQAFFLYSIVYFIIIWNLPAAWIWNPTGWLAQMGMADFAGGLVVHGAAGAAGLGIVLQVWREEKKKGNTASPQVSVKLNLPWLTLSILLLWVGWFGFNPGSVLAFNDEAMVVVLTTFLAAASAFLSIIFFRYQMTKQMPSLIYGANGVLMGLIIITPLAGFVTSLASLTFENGALVATSLPDGLFYGGGLSALNQLGIEAYGVAVVMLTVFILSFVTARLISAAMKGITTNPQN